MVYNFCFINIKLYSSEAQPGSGGLVLAALDVLGVVTVECENLLVPRYPVWFSQGRGRGGPPRPAQPLVPGLAGLPGVPGRVVQWPALYTRLARLHSDDTLGVQGAVLGPNNSDNTSLHTYPSLRHTCDGSASGKAQTWSQ